MAQKRKSYLKTDIPYVHSTTNNTDFKHFKDLNGYEEKYNAYTQQFNNIVQTLEKQKDKILSKFNSNEEFMEWLSLITNPNNLNKLMNDFKLALDGLYKITQDTQDKEKNPNGKWIPTKIKDGVYNLKYNKYRGHTETMERHLNTIKQITDMFATYNLESLTSLMKEANLLKDGRYIKAASDLAYFIEKSIIPLKNSNNFIEVIGTDKSNFHEIVVTQELLELIGSWRNGGVSQKIGQAFGFMDELIVADAIKNHTNQYISDIMQGQKNNLTDLKFIINDEIARIQLKNQRVGSYSVQIKKDEGGNPIYTHSTISNRSYKNTVPFKGIDPEKVTLANIYNLTFNRINNSEQYEPEIYYQYLMNIVFKDALTKNPINTIPNLIITPQSYYWYSDFIKEYWKPILEGDPLKSVEFFIRQINYPSVNNNSMYESKLKYRTKFLNNYERKKQNNESSNFKEYYVTTKYGKDWGQFIQDLSLNYAIWDIVYQLK